MASMGNYYMNTQQQYALHEPHSGSTISVSWTSRSTPPINLQPGPTVTDSDGSLVWLAANLDQLSRKYADKWVLIKNSTVLADSDDAIQLEQLARQQSIDNPYITKIPPSSAAWRTAYGDFVR